jgi:hypothetical protein
VLVCELDDDEGEDCGVCCCARKGCCSNARQTWLMPPLS